MSCCYAWWNLVLNCTWWEGFLPCFTPGHVNRTLAEERREGLGSRSAGTGPVVWAGPGLAWHGPGGRTGLRQGHARSSCPTTVARTRVLLSARLLLRLHTLGSFPNALPWPQGSGRAPEGGSWVGREAVRFVFCRGSKGGATLLLAVTHPGGAAARPVLASSQVPLASLTLSLVFRQMGVDPH